MTQALNLANLANYINSSGKLDASQALTGTVTSTGLNISNDASISGLTVGKGGGGDSASTTVGYLSLGAGATNTGTNNTTVGYGSMYVNTSGGSNAAFGGGALRYNTTGSSNSAIGFQALNQNTTASNNTAVGYQAGYSNTTGTGLVAVGHQALQSNTTGVANTAIGGGYTGFSPTALSGNTTGSYNIAVGSGALGNQTTASYNTAIGYQSGYGSNGNGNICIGYSSGYGATTLTTGTNNTLIGYGASTSGATDSAELVILAGNNTTPVGKGSNTGFIFVNNGSSFGGVYQGNNSTLWSITSDQRLKKNIVDNNDGLDKITQIKVRNFEYRTADEITELPKSSAIDIQGVQLGAIAQELIEVLPDCVKTESTGVMSVDASNITWHLINAVKELNAKVTALEAKLGA